MAPDPPPLPSKFPCWCRAIYSWGGETSNDLGFVEGDLIECLNAGDGLWWMGRLRRDRRMVGLFPSNFVEVLDEDFVPHSGSVTPQSKDEQARAENGNHVTPRKQRTVFRKPFQAHKEAISPSEAARRARENTPETPPSSRSRDNTTSHGSQRTRSSRTPATVPRSRGSQTKPPRAVSPSPAHEIPQSLRPRTPSPRPHTANPGGAPSHIPTHAPSHDDPARDDSPPPPPPPPHRIAVNSYSSRNSVPAPLDMNDRYTVFRRTPSPAIDPSQSEAPSPTTAGNTPSPLRDAMEDVMTSLQDMGLPREERSPSPQLSNPWSPEAYDAISAETARGMRLRPQTSLGFEAEHRPDFNDDEDYADQYNPMDRYDGPPQFNNYVQRMESRLRQLHEQNDQLEPSEDYDARPPPSQRRFPYHARHESVSAAHPPLRSRKSALDLNRHILDRTMTTRSSATNSSSGMQSVSTMLTSSSQTSQSIMSGTSAGGISATSAASYARRTKWGSFSGERPTTAVTSFHSSVLSDSDIRPQTPSDGLSYHSSHNTSRQGAMSAIPWSSEKDTEESPGVFGGLATPKAKKNGFFRRFLESAKTGAASARSSIIMSHNAGSTMPSRGVKSGVLQSPRRGIGRDSTSRETGTGSAAGTVDWVQIRRDVNRASTPSQNERAERAERCQMMDNPVIYAVEELEETAEGDESIDGLPLTESANWDTVNFGMVDKNARFVTSLPPLTNPASLAQGYVCRPYKSDLQRLRAIFTWVSEKIAWDQPADLEEEVDLKRVISMKRGSPQEVAFLVQEMCSAVGIHADVIHGYLKAPGEIHDLSCLSRPNHWWNAVLIEGEWRMMDCSLANPTNPRRKAYVTANSQHAESWYFLARPLQFCYTHVPLHPDEQHIVPAISPEVLFALPTVSPAFFKNGLQMPDFDTSQIYLEGLEVMQVRILVPPDVECAAEVEAPAFARDRDGDWFESGDIVRKRALAQPDWVRGHKRFTVKALLPGDEGQGMLKIYAGRKGLMHSCKDIPHPLAVTLPIVHKGDNPPYEFVLRHPTPHAQRHDLYIIQPQCSRLAINNTFVFAVRQHPASPPAGARPDGGASGRTSPVNPRPSSALSMVSSTYGGSNASTTSVDGFSASTSAVMSGKSSSNSREKPAKLAIQSPSGKIMRLMRKADHMAGSATESTPDGSVWETVIKIGERGVWRGLVLADRSARWCVFCEWECF